MDEPRNEKEWQEAADLAEFWRHVHSAREYGLLQYGGTINVERCEKLIASARERGITAAPVEVTLARIAGAKEGSKS
jgi:hypothetical protein